MIMAIAEIITSAVATVATMIEETETPGTTRTMVAGIIMKTTPTISVEIQMTDARTTVTERATEVIAMMISNTNMVIATDIKTS